MDMSHLSFLRRFLDISERVSGGGESFELPGIGIVQCLSAPAAFPETANSLTLTASAGCRQYPDNSASSPLSGPSATEAVRAGNGRRGQSCEHDGSAVS